MGVGGGMGMGMGVGVGVGMGVGVELHSMAHCFFVLLLLWSFLHLLVVLSHAYLVVQMFLYHNITKTTTTTATVPTIIDTITGGDNFFI